MNFNPAEDRRLSWAEFPPLEARRRFGSTLRDRKWLTFARGEGRPCLCLPDGLRGRERGAAAVHLQAAPCSQRAPAAPGISKGSAAKRSADIS